MTKQPEQHPTTAGEAPSLPAPQRLGVIGAGMMGAGIAYIAAAANLEVVLVDVTIDGAEKGKDYARRVTQKAVAAGSATDSEAAAILDRISTSDSTAAVVGCDAIIEAVFEDSTLKCGVLADASRYAPGALLASNTSTLPISELAKGTSEPANFIGIHFFSPVERMPLVEIVVGRETSPVTVDRALELGRVLERVPIVVNDGRGFFTSRVITKRIDEAIAMVGEGIDAASIDRVAREAGYPIGPLQLIDETTITLPRKVRKEARFAAESSGLRWEPHPAEEVMDRIIDELGRTGRAAGAGFYDYVDGKRIGVWPGLVEAFGTTTTLDDTEVRDRLLFAEAIETARCFDEGILRSAADANTGSVIGIGFPKDTGGVVNYMQTYPGGLVAFVARARELAERYGDRFIPPAGLVAAALTGAVR